MGAAKAVRTPSDTTVDIWAFPPPEGWTFDEVREMDLHFTWELVDGNITVRERQMLWHGSVRGDLRHALDRATAKPYVVASGQCVMLDERNVRVPDIAVYDHEGISFSEAEYVPISHVALAVEVVSPRTRLADRIAKPAQYAQAKVPYYWRVELERDRRITVHEYWLNPDTRSYIPRPERPVHRGELIAEHPFPVKIDLAELTRF